MGKVEGPSGRQRHRAAKPQSIILPRSLRAAPASTDDHSSPNKAKMRFNCSDWSLCLLKDGDSWNTQGLPVCTATDPGACMPPGPALGSSGPSELPALSPNRDGILFGHWQEELHL
ncbi:hypothetical protein P7K49_008922 [Saguinus oedipus]|uniref:Uncharacterized protein n=1 Tax=Saguinus oedipus TaxID=9490 RepID=A0ABQ9VZ51_SAGOE|nr:hypothetical protein P7K49_008922 [Saguinus oedipus]